MRDWTQLVLFFMGMSTLILWMDSKTQNEIISMREMMISMHTEIRQEMKDFHGRLCIIEERGRGK